MGVYKYILVIKLKVDCEMIPCLWASIVLLNTCYICADRTSFISFIDRIYSNEVCFSSSLCCWYV